MKQRSRFARTIATARLVTVLATAVAGSIGCGGPEADSFSGDETSNNPGMPIGSGRGGASPTAGAPAGAAPGPAGTAATTVAPQPAPPGTIVPLYTRPSDPSWAGVIAAKRAHPEVPVLAVINPANGPGAAANTDYLVGLAELEAAGIKTIGYVSTDYSRRPMAEVEADVQRWRSLYPKVTGIFFDEMSYEPGQEEHYRRATAFAKGRGFDLTIGNPGVDSSPEYVGTVDVILIYESAGLPSVSDLTGWHASHDRKNFGVIPHAVPSLDPTFVQTAKNHVRYVYVQNDTLPNPWDSIPPYFADLVRALK